MTQCDEEVRQAQRAFTPDLAHISHTLIKTDDCPPLFFPTSLTLSLSLFQGQSKERGEPAADQVQERSVEGGLGGPVWSQTLHHYHRGEQEQRRQSRVSQQPPTLKAAFEQLLQMLILFQSGSVKDGNICLPRQRTKGHNKVLTLRN